MTNLLELKGISKTFPGVKALSDVDLTFDRVKSWVSAVRTERASRRS